MRTQIQARRNLILKLVSRFNSKLQEALQPFSNEEKANILELLQQAAKHFEAKFEYEAVYTDYIDPIMTTYKNKSRKMLREHIHDYLVQSSLKLAELIDDENWDDNTDQFMNDEEYKTYMNHIHNILSKQREAAYLNSAHSNFSDTEEKHQPEIDKINKNLIESNVGLPQPESVDLKTSEKPEEKTIQFGDHLTIEQLTQFLNCSKATVHNYKAKGLPYYRIGRKVLFKKEEVLGFMRNKNSFRRK